jgi:hypothetical protein
MGFFKELDKQISREVLQRIPLSSKLRLNVKGYFNRLNSETQTVLEGKGWAHFWLDCKWLKKPSSDDSVELSETFQGMNSFLDCSLSECFIVVANSLKQLIDSNLEDEQVTKWLWEYYKLAKSEINTRLSMPHFREGINEFEDYIQTKSQHVNKIHLMEHARKHGDICPYCENKNVRSYNTSEWKCYECGKRFRKH